MKNLSIFIIAALVGFQDSGCRKPPPPVAEPIALFGPDQKWMECHPSVFLDGRNSYDPAGLPLTFNWSIISGPAGAIINEPDKSNTTMLNFSHGIYLVQLVVTNSKGKMGVKTQTIQILKNNAPIAVASFSKSYNSGIPALRLEGTNSKDPDEIDAIHAYRWKIIKGPTGGQFEQTNWAVAFLKNPVEGIYEFELEVKDNCGAFGRDTVSIEVKFEKTFVFTNLKIDCESSWEGTCLVYIYMTTANSFILPNMPLRKCYIRKHGTNDWIDITSNNDVTLNIDYNDGYFLIDNLQNIPGVFPSIDVKIEF